MVGPETLEEKAAVMEAIVAADHEGDTPRRRSVAFHEAGHVVMLWAEGIPPRGAWVASGFGAAWKPRGEKEWPPTALMAGEAGQRLGGFSDACASESDITLAAASYDRCVPRPTIPAWLVRAREVAEHHLRANWAAVEAVAEQLIRYGWIDGPTAEGLIVEAGGKRA